MSEPAHESKKDLLALEGFENLLEVEQATPEAVQNQAQELDHEATSIAQEVETIAMEIAEGY